MPDIVIVAFQEIVELTPTQVIFFTCYSCCKILTNVKIMSADPERMAIWEKAISAQLNNADNYQNCNMRKTNMFINACAQQIGSFYALIRSSQLVGAAMLLYVRCDQLALVKNVEAATKKVG
jgi:hypothetical protein